MYIFILPCIRVHGWQTSKSPSEKQPSLVPTSTTNYHTKVSQHTEPHHTGSLHRRSCTGWLKSSSLEFPPFASVIKADEGRTLSEPGPLAKLCLGTCGERLPSPSLRSAPHTFAFTFFSCAVRALMLITFNGNRQIKENNNNKKELTQIIGNAQSNPPGWGACVFMGWGQAGASSQGD